jgi:hypothetical protein
VVVPSFIVNWIAKTDSGPFSVSAKKLFAISGLKEYLPEAITACVSVTTSCSLEVFILVTW